MTLSPRLRCGACIVVTLLIATTVVDADEQSNLRQHIVMIHAETIPPGLNRYFPAIVVEATKTKSTLVSASWGAAPFPVGAKGRDIDSIHLLDSDQPVEILKYDEKLGVAVFSVDIPLKPWPIDQLASELKVGDVLEELILENRHYKSVEENQQIVSAIRTEFPSKTADGREIKVQGTIIFDGSVSGHPGTVLLKDGKLTAIFLNNSSSKRYALPARLLIARYVYLIRR